MVRTNMDPRQGGNPHLESPEVHQRVFEWVPPVALVQVPWEFFASTGARGLRLKKPHEARVPSAGRRHVSPEHLFFVRGNNVFRETRVEERSRTGVSVYICTYKTCLTTINMVKTMSFNVVEETEKASGSSERRHGARWSLACR